jgi:hypothetical protein
MQKAKFSFMSCVGVQDVQTVTLRRKWIDLLIGTAGQTRCHVGGHGRMMTRKGAEVDQTDRISFREFHSGWITRDETKVRAWRGTTVEQGIGGSPPGTDRQHRGAPHPNRAEGVGA